MQPLLADLTLNFCQILGFHDVNSVVFIAENGEDVTDDSISRLVDEGLLLLAYDLNCLQKDTPNASEVPAKLQYLTTLNLAFKPLIANLSTGTMDDQIQIFESNISVIHSSALVPLLCQVSNVYRNFWIVK